MGDSDYGQRLSRPEWYDLRRTAFTRDSNKCRNCGKESDLEAHHIVPIEAGGTNVLSNIATLCRDCHLKAHRNKRHNYNSPEQSDKLRPGPSIALIQNLFSTVSHLLERAVVGLMAKTGIGVGEVCNLNLDDLNLCVDSVLINDHYFESSWESHGPFLRIRCSGSLPFSTRRERNQKTIIPLDRETKRLLLKWLAIRPDTQNTALFVGTASSWGERISLHQVHHFVEKAAQSIGEYEKNSQLKNITPYALRYFFDKRFSGDHIVKEYLLGRAAEIEYSPKEIAENYRQHIFKLEM